ncbi:MAG TPA: site-2 protease family protein [Candidatus Limnocylindrales bacterium]|nr:site-2 protease family protein [Candidatus Limnocylindrales bacterium]
MSFDVLLPAIIVVAVMLLVAFPIHEFAHALAAYRLGDGTARMFGRVTINPIAHFDPIGGTLFAVSVLASGGSFGFGWAKPTPVNPLNLRNGRHGEALVAAAGPLANLILAVAAAIPLRYLAANLELAEQVALLTRVLIIFVQLNIILMLFNFVPVPPLDGSKVMLALVNPRTAWQLRPILEQYGIFILFVLFFFPPNNSIGGQILRPILDAIFGFLVGR